jgi:hypothetical protein
MSVKITHKRGLDDRCRAGGVRWRSLAAYAINVILLRAARAASRSKV